MGSEMCIRDRIQWMRQYNEVAEASEQLRFHGFDMQAPVLSMDSVVAFLETVDPDAAARASNQYDCFRPYQVINEWGLSFDAQFEYWELSSDVQAECRDRVQAVHDLLSANQAAYEGASTPETYGSALQEARVVVQAEHMTTALYDHRVRSAYMAENILWLLDRMDQNDKVIVWSHNFSVARTPDRVGSYLRDTLGADYVNLALHFGQAAFNARVVEGDGISLVPRRFEEGPPPTAAYEHFFNLAAIPTFLLDLAEIRTDSDQTAWLNGPRTIFSIGAVYDPSDVLYRFESVNLLNAFDAIIFVDRGTESTLLPFPMRDGCASIAEPGLLCGDGR